MNRPFTETNMASNHEGMLKLTTNQVTSNYCEDFYFTMTKANPS